jgi:hypothetical protein
MVPSGWSSFEKRKCARLAQPRRLFGNFPNMGDWVACPHCGEKIKRDAKSCRHCGSDDATGWSEATYLDAADLPGEEDYGDAMENEGFRPARGGKAAWAAVSLVLLVIFAAWLLRGFF